MSRGRLVNAADVVAALRVHYGAGYALVEQVGDSTGYRVSRHLDVIALGLWPSRGHDLHGIEVKVSKADFKRELSTPIKAEAVADRCDRFYIAAPAGVADQNLMDLLTPGWGLLEVNEATTGKRTIKVARAAKQQIGRAHV